MGDTILTRILFGTGMVVIGALIVGVAFWGFDYGAAGEIVEKDRDDSGPYIVLETATGGFDVTHYVTEAEYGLLQVGHYVVYHVQSGRVEVYSEEGGDLLYDSASVPGL